MLDQMLNQIVKISWGLSSMLYSFLFLDFWFKLNSKTVF